MNTDTNKTKLDKLKKFLSVLWHGTGESSPHWTPPPKRRPIKFQSIAELADALNRAKEAHGQFERGLGHADTNWPLWYAGFLAMEQGLLGPYTPQYAVSCGLIHSGADGQVEAPCVNKVESPTVDIASEYAATDQEYWEAHS